VIRDDGIAREEAMGNLERCNRLRVVASIEKVSPLLGVEETDRVATRLKRVVRKDGCEAEVAECGNEALVNEELTRRTFDRRRWRIVR
jgi:hypothetical protein